MRRLLLATLPLAAMATAACGVTYGGANEGNDFFLSLDVTGEKTVGAPLTAAVAYETFYPVPVDITCELRREKELIKPIGSAQAPAIPGDRGPDDERVPGNFAFDFTVADAGEHAVECYTPEDEANFIIEAITISPA